MEEKVGRSVADIGKALHRYVNPGNLLAGGKILEGAMLRKHRFLSAGLVIFIFLTLLPKITSGAIPDRWNERSYDLSAVAYGHGIFAAVGGNGRIQTSPDGAVWQIQNSGTAENLRGITFGNGLFVAVGFNGTILSSGNGISWTAQNSGISQALEDVTFGNGLFVAVGMSGTILSSPEGTTWNPQASGVTANLSGVAYGNNRFVAVGFFSTLLRSNATATLWEPKTSAGVGFGGVTYGGGRFMAIGGLGVSVSTDGEIWNWYAREGVDQFGIGYGNGVYVALTGDCMSGTFEYSLNSGQTWIKARCATSYPIGIVYGNNRFVVVGNSSIIYTSADGIHWDETVSGVTVPIRDLAYAAGQFVAVGDLDGYPAHCYRDTATILTSPDGLFWKIRPSDTKVNLKGVTHGNGQFVAVGDRLTIVTSANGLNWDTVVGPVLNYYLRDVTFGNGTFAAVGGFNFVTGSQIFKISLAVVSVDGGDWAPFYPGIPDQYLNGIAYGNGKFVAVGGEGAMTTSPDGFTWTPGNSGTSSTLNGATFGQNTFVVVGEGGTIFTSPDGFDWTPRASGTTANLHRIAYEYGAFAAVGDDGTILVSYNGLDWSPHTSGTSFNLFGVAAGKGTFIAGGYPGTFLQTDKLSYYLPLILQ